MIRNLRDITYNDDISNFVGCSSVEWSYYANYDRCDVC